MYFYGIQSVAEGNDDRFTSRQGGERKHGKVHGLTLLHFFAEKFLKA